MRRLVLLVLAALLLAPAGVRAQSPRAYIESAVEAMGGDALRDLRSLRLRGVGHTFLVEQSERPEGPFVTVYREVNELRDVPHGSRFIRATQRGFQVPDWSPDLTFVYDEGVTAMVLGERQMGAPRVFHEAVVYQGAVMPEYALRAALDAPSLRMEGGTMLQNVPHRVVAFDYTDASGLAMTLRLFLNARTDLPTAIEVARPHLFDVWGRIPHRTYYSLWTLEPTGLRYPRQWDTTIEGVMADAFTVTHLDIDPAAPRDSFLIPQETRAMAPAILERPTFRGVAMGQRGRTDSLIAPGVVELPGLWDVALVKQHDGLVVIEGPLTSDYTDLVFAEAERRFPGVPIKAVVTTSDAWPHVGGLRPYIARGIPIYALDLNVPIVERIAAAHDAERPDALAQAPREANIVTVSGPTPLGAGTNRLMLYPVRGETSERMLMAYLPNHRLLYGADLIQIRRDGSFWMPQYLDELAAAVAREGIAVDRAFALHASPVPWVDVLDAIEAAKQRAE